MDGGSEPGAAMISAADEDRPERPDAADAEVRRGAHGAIISPSHPVRHFLAAAR